MGAGTGTAAGVAEGDATVDEGKTGIDTDALRPGVFIPLSCQAGIPGGFRPNVEARVEILVLATEAAGVESAGGARLGRVVEVESVGVTAAVGGEGIAGTALVGRRVSRSDLSDFNSADRSVSDWVVVVDCFSSI